MNKKIILFLDKKKIAPIGTWTSWNIRGWEVRDQFQIGIEGILEHKYFYIFEILINAHHHPNLLPL